MGNKKLGTIELIPKRKFYDYKAKYDKNAKTKHLLPVDLPKNKLNEIHNLGYKYEVFKEFGPDTQTWYHSTFYKYLKSEKGEKMQKIYDNLKIGRAHV